MYLANLFVLSREDKVFNSETNCFVNQIINLFSSKMFITILDSEGRKNRNKMNIFIVVKISETFLIS